MYFLNFVPALLGSFVIPHQQRRGIGSFHCGTQHVSSVGLDASLAGAEVPVSSDKYETLLDWLRRNQGGVSSKIDVLPSSRGGGYGMFAKSDIKKGELLISVPRSSCVTLDAVKSDPDCGDTFVELIKKAGTGGLTVAMAGYLAKEQLKFAHDQKQGAGNNEYISKYGPYLSTLPWQRGINGQEHILFWSDDEIETYMKGSMSYGEATDLRAEVELATRVLNSIVGNAVLKHRGELSDTDGGFSWPWEKKEKAPPPKVEGLDEAVRGAFVCLLSRSFKNEDEGDIADEEEYLVPVLDILQHSDDPNIRHKTSDDGTVEVTARRDLRPGEELFNQYISEEEEFMPYHRFFTRFGFVPGVMEPIQNLLEDKSSIFFAQKQEV